MRLAGQYPCFVRLIRPAECGARALPEIAASQAAQLHSHIPHRRVEKGTQHSTSAQQLGIQDARSISGIVQSFASQPELPQILAPVKATLWRLNGYFLPAAGSPDGRWVVYSSNESGRREIYVAPSTASPYGSGGAASGKRQVSTSGGQQPRWRTDGKEIFYVAPGGRLMAAEVGVKGTAFEAGAVRELFGPILTGEPFQYDVSADGQHFLVITQTEQKAGEPLTLVQNWIAGLKK